MKTQKNSDPSENGLSKRALRRFLGVGNSNPTHEYFEIKSFHTAWGESSHWRSYAADCGGDASGLTTVSTVALETP